MVTALAPILLAISVHLFGGPGGGAALETCSVAEGEPLAAARSCVSRQTRPTSIAAAEHAPDPLVGFEFKPERDKDDTSPELSDRAMFADGLDEADPVRGPPREPRSLGVGEDSVSRHSPRGPPLG